MKRRRSSLHTSPQDEPALVRLSPSGECRPVRTAVPHRLGYSQYDVACALRTLLRGRYWQQEGAVAATAARYNIPRTTLSTRVQQRLQLPHPSTDDSLHSEGARYALSPAEELQLAAQVRAANACHRGLHLAQLLQLVRLQFPAKKLHNGSLFTASPKWCYAFLTRHKIVLRSVHHISDTLTRTVQDEQKDCEAFWRELDSLCESYRISNSAMYNLDEVCFSAFGISARP